MAIDNQDLEVLSLGIAEPQLFCRAARNLSAWVECKEVKHGRAIA
jgi:hypothetical protein